MVEGSIQGFERGFEFGGQTKEHAFLVKRLGVERLIVVINKMDLMKWDKLRYQEICNRLENFLTAIGYAKENVMYVPLSAFYAENIVEKSHLPEAKWYTGLCLMDLLGKTDKIKVYL